MKKGNNGRRWRFLSETDRADFVWFFTAAEAAIAPLRSTLDPSLYEDQVQISGNDANVRPLGGGSVHVSAGKRHRIPREPEMDDRVYASARARWVEAIVRRMAEEPDGKEQVIDLHDAYVFPQVIRGSATACSIGQATAMAAKLAENEPAENATERIRQLLVPLSHNDGERLIMKLRSGHVVQGVDHQVLNLGHDEIPGIVCREGDGAKADDFRADLERACRAFEQAKAQVGPRPKRPTESAPAKRTEITKADAARLRGVSRTQIQREIEAGLLRTVTREGREMVLVTDEIEENS